LSVVDTKVLLLFKHGTEARGKEDQQETWILFNSDCTVYW